MIKYLFIQDNHFLSPSWKLSCDHAKFIFIIFRTQLPAILIKLSANYVPKTVAAFHANQSCVFQRSGKTQAKSRVANSTRHRQWWWMVSAVRLLRATRLIIFLYKPCRYARFQTVQANLICFLRNFTLISSPKPCK